METKKSVINLEKGVNFFKDEKEKLDRTEKKGRIKCYFIEKLKNLKNNYYRLGQSNLGIY